MSIRLWRPVNTVSSDEAGTIITSYTLPAHVTGPYDSKDASSSEERLTYVPSLQSICIRQLIAFPEQLHVLGPIQLPYKVPRSPTEYDLLRELIPGFSHASAQTDHTFLKYIDPRLWATLIQLYSGLPDAFRSYNLPLSDIHMPILQQIPSTKWFALVTTLQLRFCSGVDDDTIIELRELHGLVALDVGATALSCSGVRRLSKTLGRATHNDSGLRRLTGPWGLRYLCLRDCINIKDDVYKSLQEFPLLSVVDLRGTRCTPASYTQSHFRVEQNPQLFHPTSLHDTLTELNKLCIPTDSSGNPALLSHPEPYYLRVDSLDHVPALGQRRPAFINPLINDCGYRPLIRERGMLPLSEDIEDRHWTLSSPSRPPRRRIPAGFACLPKLSRQGSALRPLVDNTRDEQDFIAAEEARRTAASAFALAFYSTVSPRRLHVPFNDTPEPLRPSIPMMRPAQIVINSERTRPTGLTLYREPPPWSTLDKFIDADDSSARLTTTFKKPRMEIDSALITAKGRKRKGDAKQAVEAIWGMVGRRGKDTSADEEDANKRGVPITANPFLRKMERSTFEDARTAEGKPTVVLASTSGSRSAKPESSKVNTCDDGLGAAAQKSILSLPPPPPSKPLRPISTLSVPARPPETVTPKSVPQRKPADGASSRSIDKATQMKISVFAEEAAKKGSSKALLRDLPRSTGKIERKSSLNPSKSADFRAARQDLPKSEAGRAVHGKRKTSENDTFDWKRWSTG